MSEEFSVVSRVENSMLTKSC